MKATKLFGLSLVVLIASIAWAQNPGPLTINPGTALLPTGNTMVFTISGYFPGCGMCGTWTATPAIGGTIATSGGSFQVSADGLTAVYTAPIFNAQGSDQIIVTFKESYGKHRVASAVVTVHNP